MALALAATEGEGESDTGAPGSTSEMAPTGRAAGAGAAPVQLPMAS